MFPYGKMYEQHTFCTQNDTLLDHLLSRRESFFHFNLLYSFAEIFHRAFHSGVDHQASLRGYADMACQRVVIFQALASKYALYAAVPVINRRGDT